MNIMPTIYTIIFGRQNNNHCPLHTQFQSSSWIIDQDSGDITRDILKGFARMPLYTLREFNNVYELFWNKH